MSKAYNIKDGHLWSGIGGNDFIDEKNVFDEDIGDYNEEKMIIFSANTNLQRQLVALSDSLKPVERRILYVLYLMEAFPSGKTLKSNNIVGNVMVLHPHSDASIYKTAVGMSQDWKRAVPLIHGEGNFGGIISPEEFAHQRYTEMKMSKYAAECFFEDFDLNCVEMKPSNGGTKKYAFEPFALPAKFPNILVNGGMGIAFGNAFTIPPYNIHEIVDVCKKLIKDPAYGPVYLVPDLPTGVDIVDNNGSLVHICETGMGNLKMRSKIDIHEHDKEWEFRVSSIPWMSSLTSIKESLVNLTKSGAIPIKNFSDYSMPIAVNGITHMELDFRVYVDKTYDPNAIRAKLYKLAGFEKSISIRFKVIKEGFDIECLSMKDLIMSWLDERREYKRRLFNRKVAKLTDRKSFLEILVELLSSSNIEKVVSIIKHNNAENCEKALISEYGMSSHQAAKVAEMKLRLLNEDTRARSIKELADIDADLIEVMSIIKSEKKIDAIILNEIDMLKKYGSARKSHIVDAGTDNEISNTDHTLIITKRSLIKKLPYKPESYGNGSGYGVFAQYDYPIERLVANNLDSVMMFDTMGKYSCVPVHSIDNTEPSYTGNKVYDFTKLEGGIVGGLNYVSSLFENSLKDITNQSAYIVTVTKEGYGKKTPISEFATDRAIKNTRACKLRDKDELIKADIVLEKSTLIIYTKKGRFIMMPCTELPDCGKNAVGNSIIKVDDDDECAGFSIIGGSRVDYIIVVTEKGCVKKCDLKFTETSSKRRQGETYLTTLDGNDNVLFCDVASEDAEVVVCTRTGYKVLEIEDIPTLSRRAKPKKLIPLSGNDNIISVVIDEKK